MAAGRIEATRPAEARYLGMDHHILTKDTGAAIGLITGIILGSLLLNLAGSY